MSKRQKIIVISVLALIVVLYSGAVANGGRSGQGNAGHSQGGFVGWLGGLFGGPAKVAPADVTGDCLAGRTMTVKGSCVLHIAKSSKGTRQLTLHATTAVGVTSRPPQQKDTVEADVKAGDDVKVTVDGNGGDVTVACAGGTDTCTLTLP